jgi:hypothetical protein
MARIEGTNVSFGNPELHGYSRDPVPVQAPQAQTAPIYKVASSVAPSLTSQSPSIAQTARQAYDTQAARSVRDQIEKQAAMSFLNPDYTQGVMLNRAADQLQSRMNQIGYPSVDALGNFFNRQQADVLAMGGTPVFVDGRYEGVTKDGRYSGNPLFDPARVAYEQKFGKTEDDRQEVVLPEYDATANAKRCPDGYVFDEQLQACRLATTIPNMPTTDRTAFYQQPYQPMGLLDQDGYEYGVPLIYG